ncbi:hypothetical protein ASPCADRAFT_202751, partial [Aspergillus carbonarius ITEM 5010]
MPLRLLRLLVLHFARILVLGPTRKSRIHDHMQTLSSQSHSPRTRKAWTPIT